MPSAAVASASSTGPGSSSKKKKTEDASKKSAPSKSASSSGQSTIGSFFAPAGQKSINSFFAPAKEKTAPKDTDSLKKKDEVACENEKQPTESTPSKPQKEKASEIQGQDNADDCVMVLSDSDEKDDAQMKRTPPTAKKIEVAARATAKGDEVDKTTSDSAITAKDSGEKNGKVAKEKDKGKGKAADSNMAAAAPSADKQDKPASVKTKKEGKKEEGGPRQGTLDFGKCAMKDWKTIWKKKERPQHPAGKELELSDRHIMVLQFVHTFRKALALPALSADELQAGLQSDEVLSTLHTQLLRTIVRDGETPDEESLLDHNTWPEVLRQHLQDVHGAVHEAIWQRLEKQEYAELSAEERLSTLVVLVDDCLASKTVRKTVDGSLDHLEEMRRQQMLDEIQEKCKKVESTDGHVGELDVFVEDVSMAEEGKEMTERQRSLQKQREEEARVQRIADEKRMREEKRAAEEESKRKQQIARAKREETRAAQLQLHHSIVRVPQLSVQHFNYWVMDGIEPGERRLLCEQRGQEDAERNKWSLHATAKDYVELLEYWNPKHPENDAKFQKKLRDFLPPAATPATEDKADTQKKMQVEEEGDQAEHKEVEGEEEEKGGKEEEEGEKKEAEKEKEEKEEEVGGEASKANAKEEEEKQRSARSAAALARAQEVVMCLDECTPDDMFSDLNAYCEAREGWRASVEEAAGLEALDASVAAFEAHLKRAKMQEGWDEVRPKWLLDVGQAATVACLSYLVKQLRVYIGKQKVKPGKLAAIFHGPMRMTRTRARLEQGLPDQRKRLVEESSGDEEEESSGGGEEESAGEEWAEEKEEEERKDKRERRGGGRASLRPCKVLKTANRTSARPLRSSSRLAATGSRSLREVSEGGSESDNSDEEARKPSRSERVTRRRQRVEEEEDESDASGPATRRRSSRLTGR